MYRQHDITGLIQILLRLLLPRPAAGTAKMHYMTVPRGNKSVLRRRTKKLGVEELAVGSQEELRAPLANRRTRKPKTAVTGFASSPSAAKQDSVSRGVTANSVLSSRFGGEESLVVPNKG
jgi:hypothetical protein